MISKVFFGTRSFGGPNFHSSACRFNARELETDSDGKKGSVGGGLIEGKYGSCLIDVNAGTGGRAIITVITL